ncbi:hypothetical protein BVC80_6349g2 [Macleaya cordata]|uniref:Uncharacterized protein n=1 Tax=Macleaya cordata TaxID=56857 RepID=A0A200QNA0_MACCD|nr:hypothetical protein BVC80_6349g2 [Macleaya cordata]
MNSMALTTSKVSAGPMVTNRANVTEPCGIISTFSKSIQHNGVNPTIHRVELRRPGYGRFLAAKLIFSSEALWHISGKPCTYAVGRENSALCQSTGTHNTEAKECFRNTNDCSDVARYGFS